MLSVGLADLVGGFSGRPQGWVRSVLAWILGSGAGLALAWLLDFSAGQISALGGLLAIWLPFWFWVRAQERLSVARGATGFWGLLFVLFGLIAVGAPEPRERGPSFG